MKIVFLIPIRYFASMAFVVESMEALAERGYEIDLIVPTNLEIQYKPKSSKIRLITYPDSRRFFYYLYLSFFRKVYLYHRFNSYDIVIAVSQKGLMAASFFMSFKKPIIYFSDEIYTGYEGGKWYKKLYNRTCKYIEQFCNKRVVFSVTQDSMRANLLSKVNRIYRKSIMTLPNSFSGKAEPKKSNYLQKKLHIPKESNILLSVGMIPEGSGYLELAKEARDWPKEYRLIFHMRHFVNSKKQPYANETLRLVDNKRVYASKIPVSYNTLIKIIASCKIGLALYGNRSYKDLNAIFIGYSSGKVNLYLKLGIPVIVQDFPGFKWIEEYKVGFCISKPEEVLNAAKKIISNYNYYSRNAIKIFEEQLSFDRAFEKIEDKIKTMIISKNKEV